MIIDEILNNIHIFDILEMMPNKLILKGDNYVGRCPCGHDSESGTSFQVCTTSPIFSCFNCGVKGNYLHLFELILHGVSSSGKGYTSTFAETIKTLALKYNIEYKISKEDRQKIQLFQIIEDICANYNNQLTDEDYTKLNSIYGFTKEFINQEKIGVCRASCKDELKSKYTKEEFLSTGMFWSAGNDMYRDRYVFPYKILGQIKYTAGRAIAGETKPFKGGYTPKYLKQLVHSEKHSFVSPLIKNPILFHNKDHEEIIICEGIPDYYVAKQNGLNAISAVTVQFKNDDYEQMTKICEQFHTVYICNDSESNQSGLKGAIKTSEYLIKVSKNTRIVMLPRPVDTDKIDLADYVKIHGLAEFVKCKEKAIGYIEFMINKIPEDTDKLLLMDKLRPIKELLSYLDEQMIELHVRHNIKDRFKMSRLTTILTSIKKDILDIKTIRENASLANIDFFEDADFDDSQIIESGQCFHRGAMYYTIYKQKLIEDKDGNEELANVPYVISSRREISEVIGGNELKNNFRLNKKIPNSNQISRWSFKKIDNSIADFIQNGISIDTKTIFDDIVTIFKKHVYFKREGTAEFLALVTMASYIYKAVPTIGYVHIWADKRSGKTLALNILEDLGFNPLMSSNITEAAMFRIIELHKPLLLMDEAEHLNPSAKQIENGSGAVSLINLLKSGYKKGGSAIRCEGQDNIPTTFDVFCPKVFAGTKTIDPILEDRTILLKFQRADKDLKLEEYISYQVEERNKSIVDKLHVWGLSHAGDVYKEFLDFNQRRDENISHKIYNREAELWAPYLSIARLIGDDVYQKMLSFANMSITFKENQNKDSKNLMILEELYLWIVKYTARNIQCSDDQFCNEEIKEFLFELTKDEEFAYVKMKYFKNILVKYDVVKDGDLSIRFRRINSQHRGMRIVKDMLIKSLILYKPNPEHEDIEAAYRSFEERKNSDSIPDPEL
ncbi:MAG: CHC2 zinc finger domain-containing protein [Candidatus Hodarchaeales archaeon]